MRPALCRSLALWGVVLAGTGDNGEFRFELEGRDAQDGFGTAREFSLTALAPPHDNELSGPATDLAFLVQRSEVGLGAITTWRPRLIIGADGGVANVAWSAKTETGSGSVTFDDGHGGVVWQQPGSGSAGFDVRLLEGFSGGASVLAEDERPGPDTRIRTRYRSQRVPYVTSVPPPPSRGTDCVVERTSGERETRSPCPLTDGGLESVDLGFSSAVVDLGSPRGLSLLAVRGCAEGATCTVEHSVDHRTWQPLATANEPFAAATVDAGTPIRYLRISSSAPTLQLAEVSGWEGGPEATASLAVVPPERLDAPRTAAATSANGPPWLWLGLGALTLLTVAALLGFRIGRGKRAPGTA
ncbi:hypothetical protein [Actinophytocola algeriensis]|uniref:Uncharacterized protein n=1 Tax=Actinophytocola algeriensis TaxID=1768010 RepID=A0A7W7VFB5_9PSEU|nr:hypothetical protein [Actinophytocola algeriensis]MBB4908158.1 hypothetical protein [Actinophytocola algeriensis]MBE1480188.1 hypothetical protein [Actinophytocola algeriensis]